MKVVIDGVEIDAQPVSFQEGSESWNTYLLPDGKTLRVKAVLMAVHTVPGAADAQGRPVYAVETQNVVAVDG